MARRGWMLMGLVVLAAGCEEKKAAPAATRPDAKQEAKSAAEAKLGAALAAASAAASAGKKTAATAAPTEGPPPNGVFATGTADKAMARGAPPKVELMNEGSEPRVALLSAVASWKGSATITTGVRLGPRNALPSVEYAVSLGPEKKKDKDKEADASAPLLLLGDVTGAKLAADQPGKLPEGTQKEAAKLKGSLLRWRSTDLGVAWEPGVTLSKEATPELSRSVEAAAEAMFYASVPPPAKPVGVGASWIVGSRQALGGVEVISYRLYKVLSVGPDGVKLSLESHEYATQESLAMEGLPKGATLAQFEATAQGEIELPAREALGQKAQITRQMTLGLRVENTPPGAVASIQFVSEATVRRGK